MTEPTTVGLSPETHEKLKALQQGGTFKEMADAYRLGVAYALFERVDVRDLPEVRGGTIFNVGTLDPDRILYSAVSALTSEDAMPVYRRLERLADWGVSEIYMHHHGRRESLSSMFAKDE